MIIFILNSIYKNLSLLDFPQNPKIYRNIFKVNIDIFQHLENEIKFFKGFY